MPADLGCSPDARRTSCLALAPTRMREVDVSRSLLPDPPLAESFGTSLDDRMSVALALPILPPSFPPLAAADLAPPLPVLRAPIAAAPLAALTATLTAAASAAQAAVASPAGRADGRLGGRPVPAAAGAEASIGLLSPAPSRSRPDPSFGVAVGVADSGFAEETAGEAPDRSARSVLDAVFGADESASPSSCFFGSVRHAFMPPARRVSNGSFFELPLCAWAPCQRLLSKNRYISSASSFP